MKILNKHLGLSLVSLLSLFAILPLFQPGFFPVHDDTQVARVYEMGKALTDGMFPVRWVQDLGYGYGYPIFNFYSPLPYYFGGLLAFLGVDALLATKAMFAVGILLSGIFMYFLAKEFWGEACGVLSSLLYMYVPYHAVQIYVRGAVGEFWAYAFIPLMSLGFYKVFQKSMGQVDFLIESAKLKSQSAKPQLKTKNGIWKWVVVGATGYAGVILSHNLIAMMVTPFLLIVLLLYGYVAFKHQKVSTIYYLLFTILLGITVSAFYWVPALFEMRYTNVVSQVGGGADYNDHFVCLSQFWESPWGFGGSAPGCVDGMSFKLGKLNMILFFASFFLFVWRFLRIKQVARLFHLEGGEDKFIFLFSVFGFFLSVFLMLEQSKFFWDAIPVMAFLQYPWRFLNLANFFMSLSIGFCVRSVLTSRTVLVKRAIFVLVIIAFTLFSNVKLFQPQTYYLRGSSFYTNGEYLKWTVSKISDEYMPSGFKKSKAETEILQNAIDIVIGTGSVEDVSARTGQIRARINAQEALVMRLNIAYFPAWNLWINGVRSEFEIRNDGLYAGVPRGTSMVEAKFLETSVQKVSNVISVVGVLAVFSGIIASITFVHYGKKAS